MNVLSLDIGTTTVKGALFDEGGQVLALARERSPEVKTSGLGAGSASPRGWHDAVVRIVPRLLASGKPDALVVTGNGPSFFPVDANLEPLSDALVWLDERARAEAEEAASTLGLPQDAGFAMPKALWFARHRPEIWEKTAWFTTPGDWISALLSGNPAVAVPHPYFEPYFWNAGFLAALGLNASKFPTTARHGTFLGRTDTPFASSLALPSSCAVFAGCPDFMAAQLGSGTVTPGTALDRAGTSEALNCCLGRRFDEECLFWLPHAVDGLWNASGGLSTSGRALDWICGLAGVSSVREGLSLAETAAAAPPLLFLPHLSGERAPLRDADARGAFVGLSLAHGKAETVLAVLEATAFGLRRVTEIMEDKGHPLKAIRASGMPSTSDLWMQIKADALGIPFETLEVADAELSGGACIALAGMNRFGSASEASLALVRAARRYEPETRLAARYGERYCLWKETYDSLKGIFPRLTANGGMR